MDLRTTAALAAVLALATPALGADCADCDGDGAVSIDELVTGITIALGDAPTSACAAFDGNRDGTVTIDELVGAISDALSGCASVATPTATPPDEATPTATPTPTGTSGSQLPPTEEAALMDWLQAGSYVGWQAESGPHPGAGPHFGVVRTFVNDALFASLADSRSQHPAGAAAVKELYGSGTTVRGWAVMRKVQDESDLGRGWYWYEAFDGFSSGGIGNPGCTGCHSRGRDFIRIPFPLQ